MIRVVVWIVLILLHIIICVFTYLGMRSRVLKVPRGMIYVVVLVPFWGALGVMALQLQHWLHREHEKELGVERVRINEEIYRSILTERSRPEDEVVPLEEALIINDPKLRRSLMMDILNHNPGEYARILENARMNEDVEVVHYATTAMAEVSKEFDIQLQQLEAMYAKEPENEKNLDDYCDFLKIYLDRNMVTGQMRIMQMRQYVQLLQKRLEREPDEKIYTYLAKAQLELCDYAEVERTINQMKKYWPQRESVWLLQLQSFAQQGEGAQIQRLIQRMEEQHIYLSGKGQEVIKFWKRTEKQG